MILNARWDRLFIRGDRSGQTMLTLHNQICNARGGVTVNHNQLHCCGWVGMAGGVDCWGKIKINDQLSPSEEETGTELGEKIILKFLTLYMSYFIVFFSLT